MLKQYKSPILIISLFVVVAVVLWRATGSIFFLFNFLYIGSMIGLGMILYIKGFRYARLVVQFAVGSYMLIFLGILSRENMMLAGFWYYLFLGVFQAAVIHYAVAKIFGPLVFGRGWCGYACWTAMILDLLPYKTPKGPRREKLGILRYILFIVSLLSVSALFLLKVPNLENIMFLSFIVGNLAYYAVGIGLAYKLKDNRAFCKYICPITVFLKPASYYSITRIHWEEEKCIDCGACLAACPMDVVMTDNKRSRVNGTECILCQSCVNACPEEALRL